MVRIEIVAEMAPDYNPEGRSPEAEPLDNLFDRAFNFVGTRPSFTPQALHEYLLRFYPLSSEPSDFEEILPKILECIAVLAEINQVTGRVWICEGAGYETALYSFVERTDDIVEASIVALPESTMAEPESFEEDDIELVEGDELYDEPDDGAETDDNLPEDEPDEAGDDILTIAGDVTFAARPRPRTVVLQPMDFDYHNEDPVSFSGNVLNVARQPGRIEAPPARPDAPFIAEEMEVASKVINRLSWATARAEGVPIEALSRYLASPGFGATAAKTVLARMWFRGHLERHVSDAGESRLSLPSDFPVYNATEWFEEVRAMNRALSREFIPAPPAEAEGWIL